MRENKLPGTLIQAIRYFSDLDVATEFFAGLRWPDGPICPRCSGRSHSYLAARRLWKCKTCKRQFSVKVGSIFEDSPLGLDKWLPSVWLIANSKNGISSHELARALGVTQKSAWFMLHRIRLAMQTGSFNKISGTVEVDETYIGGKAANMHKAAREVRIAGRGNVGKTGVQGARKRETGTVHAEVIGDDSLAANVAKWVEPGSVVYTDDARAYHGLGKTFAHSSVVHDSEYVRGAVHTNGIENFWSLLKRGLHGTYVSVDPAHLSRYVDERAFTYNLRDLTDLDRFVALLGNVAGRRLTYSELTAR
ncbi:MAG: IS1595 family transposase [Candidatus Dormiibacterota bacterium]